MNEKKNGPVKVSQRYVRFGRVCLYVTERVNDTLYLHIVRISMLIASCASREFLSSCPIMAFMEPIWNFEDNIRITKIYDLRRNNKE